MKKLLLVILAITLFLSAKATHQYGSDITWTCVGQDSFLVKYTYYRDCSGIQGSAGYLYTKCHANDSLLRLDTLSFTSTVDITPVCIGVVNRCQNSSSGFPYGIEKSIAYKLLYLGNVGACCEIRFENYGDSRVLTTNTNGGAGVYAIALLNRCLTPCDNSPQFTNNPLLLTEVNKDFTYNHGVYDIDMDSIAFEWTPPLNNMTNQLSYNGGFTYNKPVSFWGFPNANLPFPRGYHLDEVTGDISFRSMKVESSCMVVKVSEWRNINGSMTKIGEVRRDMAIQVISGNGNNSPKLTSQAYYHVCGGDTLDMTLSSSDSDFGDTVVLQLNNKPDNSVWSDNNKQLNHASGNLLWATDTSDIHLQPYVLNLSAFDDNCPLLGQYSKSYLIFVDSQPAAQLGLSKLNCNRYRLRALHQKYVHQVKWYIGGQLYASSPTCFFNVSQSGTYPICMELLGGTCSKKIYDTLFIPQLLDLVLPADSIICKGESIFIQPSIAGAMSHVKYNWNTGDTSSSIQLGPLYQDTLLILNVSDSLYCDIDSMWVKVDQFDLFLKQDTITCPGNPVELTAYPVFDKGQQVNSYLWLDVSCTCPKGHTDSIIVYMPAVYSCEAVNENGCKALDTIVVLYDDEPKISFLPIPDICLNDENVALDSFVNPKGGIWYGQDTVIIKNNLFRVKKAEAKPYLIFYSYTDTLTNCFTFDKTTVIVKDYPKINILKPFSFCNVDEIFNLDSFVAPVGGQWNSGNGIVFGHYFEPISANQSQPLTYEVTDTNGCSNVKEINFRINPLPQIDFEADKYYGKIPLPIQFTNKSSITTGDILNYLWYFGDGDSSLVEHPLHAYLAPGFYDVILHAISDSGCWGTLSKEQMIEVYVGIEENNINNKIKVYPNPTKDFILIESTAPEVKINNLILINSLGEQCMFFDDLNHNSLKIERQNLPSGYYFIKIFDSKGNVYVQKMLLE